MQPKKAGELWMKIKNDLPVENPKSLRAYSGDYRGVGMFNT